MALLAVALFPLPVQAFDYLEHSYFADRGCEMALDILNREAADHVHDGAWQSRVAALTLACPVRRKAQYCVHGYKQEQSGLLPLASPVTQSGDQALTFGDFAALPDHVSEFGPIAGFPRARASGLLADLLGWLAEPSGSLGGIIGDVAEDACETDPEVDWRQVENDVQGWTRQTYSQTLPGTVAPGLQSPPRRRIPPHGPADPDTLYSFDNPHYLDLVLRSTHHFGAAAYSTWLGFHSAAIEIAQRSCAANLGGLDLDWDALTDELPPFAGLAWSEMSAAGRVQKGCALLTEAVRRRLVWWLGQQKASHWRKIVDFVRPMAATPAYSVVTGSSTIRLRSTVSALLALLFEGSGLHFLQDGFAAGHLRAAPRRDMADRRYDHAIDNRQGVRASLQTGAGITTVVLYGDEYMLGPQPGGATCTGTPGGVGDADPGQNEVTACILREQRGRLVTAGAASLLDMVQPVTSVSSHSSACQSLSGSARMICLYLPWRAAVVPGYGSRKVFARPLASTLPIPEPPFSYQSLSIGSGFDVAGSASQLSLNIALYEGLGPYSTWLTSHRIGVRITSGTGQLSQFMFEYGYRFHWRWAARFLVDAGLYGYQGFRGLQTGINYFAGFGPETSITILPEGWLKIPLEVSIGYRFPMTWLTSRDGFTFHMEGHWFDVGIGLAFM